LCGGKIFHLTAHIDTDTDTGLLVCSQKAKIENKHKTQVKYSAKKVWQQGRIVNSSGFTTLKNAATVQNIKT